MNLKNRMLCYIVGSLLTGIVLTVVINVVLLAVFFPTWIQQTGQCHGQRACV